VVLKRNLNINLAEETTQPTVDILNLPQLATNNNKYQESNG